MTRMGGDSNYNAICLEQLLLILPTKALHSSRFSNAYCLRYNRMDEKREAGGIKLRSP